MGGISSVNFHRRLELVLGRLDLEDCLIEFQEIDLHATAPSIEKNGAFARVELHRRSDPLFGTSCRVISGTKLFREEDPELETLVRRSGFCPFCEDNVSSATFPFPEKVVEGGRIRRGDCWVVPNVLAYSTASAVGIYDVSRHFIPIKDFDENLLYNAFSAMLHHTRAVREADSSLSYSSINANYLPSSGSSLVHPHLQSSHDFVPLSVQSLLETASLRHLTRWGVPYLTELIEKEQNGPRWVAQRGKFSWLTPFSPSGFHEVWAVHTEIGDLTELEEADIRDFAQGLSRVMAGYSHAKLGAFNFSLLGGGSEWRENGSRLLFRMVSRSSVEPYYRSDVTYFEKLCNEALIDMTPEKWCEALRGHFE